MDHSGTVAAIAAAPIGDDDDDDIELFRLPPPRGYGWLPLCICASVVLCVVVTCWKAWSATLPEPLVSAQLAAASPGTSAAGRALLARLPQQAQLAVTDPQAKLDISRDKARLINAEIPLATSGLVPATPLLFSGATSDRMAAADCLAAAVYYEAGDDQTGQKAVAQVVLNRLRSPLFPKTICGVIFQGSERSSGCQFTFTCDGSMAARKPGEAAWRRARDVAENALNGSVYSPVGGATHYHANYVVPYWSGAMEKIAQVGVHLFYRWRGSAGDLPRIGVAARPEPSEPAVLQVLAGRSQVAQAGQLVEVSAPPSLVNQVPAVADPSPKVELAVDGTKHLLKFDATAAPQSFAMAALRICRGEAKCQVFGYVGDAPSDPAHWGSLRTADFYFDGGKAGSNLPYWNCARFTTVPSDRCIAI